MTAPSVVECVLLGGVVLFCWIGSLGMLVMREPMQSLHYLSLPACAGSFLLVIAVFVKTGSSQAAWKSLLIFFVLLAANSVVAHATARAFRTRALGHWEPRPGDPAEFIPSHAKENEG
jgi:multisubunit Na+/H+ antiporter MnhG subunit